MKCYSCRKYDTCQLDWKCSADMYFCSAYEVEQTNEEWLRQCNTEQLAEFICNVGFENETIVRKFKSEWVKWLKQPHINKE